MYYNTKRRNAAALKIYTTKKTINHLNLAREDKAQKQPQRTPERRRAQAHVHAHAHPQTNTHAGKDLENGRVEVASCSQISSTHQLHQPEHRTAPPPLPPAFHLRNGPAPRYTLPCCCGSILIERSVQGRLQAHNNDKTRVGRGRGGLIVILYAAEQKPFLCTPHTSTKRPTLCKYYMSKTQVQARPLSLTK